MELGEGSEASLDTDKSVEYSRDVLGVGKSGPRTPGRGNVALW